MRRYQSHKTLHISRVKYAVFPKVRGLWKTYSCCIVKAATPAEFHDWELCVSKGSKFLSNVCVWSYLNQETLYILRFSTLPCQGIENTSEIHVSDTMKVGKPYKFRDWELSVSKEQKFLLNLCMRRYQSHQNFLIVFQGPVRRLPKVRNTLLRFIHNILSKPYIFCGSLPKAIEFLWFICWFCFPKRQKAKSIHENPCEMYIVRQYQNQENLIIFLKIGLVPCLSEVRKYSLNVCVWYY